MVKARRRAALATRILVLFALVFTVGSFAATRSGKILAGPAVDAAHAAAAVPPTEARRLDLLLLGSDGRPVTGKPAQAWLIMTAPRDRVLARTRWINVDRVTDGHLSIGPMSLAPNPPQSRAQPVPQFVPDAFGVAVRVPGVGFGVVRSSRWPTRPVAINLQPTSSISGRVIAADGRPAAGRLVIVAGALPDAESRFLQGWRIGTTDTDGRFTAIDLAPGRCEVRAQFPDGDRLRLVDPAPGMAPLTLTAADRMGPQLNTVDLPGPSAEMYVKFGARVLQSFQRFPSPDGAGLLLVHSPLGGATVPGIRIEGHVLSRTADGAPAGGVPVAIMDSHSRFSGGMVGTTYDADVSSPDGAVSLTVPTPGSYTMLKALGLHGEYAVEQEVIAVPAGGLRNQVFPVSPLQSIRLRVLTPDAKPLAGNPVQVRASAWTPGSNYTMSVGNGEATDPPTAADGLITIHPYEAFNTARIVGIDLNLHARGVGGGRLHLASWPDGIVDVTVTGGRSIGGHVEPGNGGPLPFITVSAELFTPRPRSALSQNMGNARVEKDGSFMLSGLSPGYYVVTAIAPFTRATQLVDATDANPAAVTLRLPATQSITGRVLDEAGRPVGGVWLYVYRLVGSDVPPRLQQTGSFTRPTDVAGRFRVDDLQPGLHFISVETQDGRQAMAHVNLRPGKSNVVDLRLQPAHSLVVRVLDAAGKPIAGARVADWHIERESHHSIPSTDFRQVTDADGRCTILNVEAGQYLITATIPGAAGIQKMVTLDIDTRQISLKSDR